MLRGGSSERKKRRSKRSGAASAISTPPHARPFSLLATASPCLARSREPRKSTPYISRCKASKGAWVPHLELGRDDHRRRRRADLAHLLRAQDGAARVRGGRAALQTEAVHLHRRLVLAVGPLAGLHCARSVIKFSQGALFSIALCVLCVFPSPSLKLLLVLGLGW